MREEGRALKVGAREATAEAGARREGVETAEVAAVTGTAAAAAEARAAGSAVAAATAATEAVREARAAAAAAAGSRAASPPGRSRSRRPATMSPGWEGCPARANGDISKSLV
jgi:hypothetical protein